MLVSSTRKDYAWTNSHHIAGGLLTGVQKLKDAMPNACSSATPLRNGAVAIHYRRER